MRVFYKEEIPEYLHYRNDDNIGLITSSKLLYIN
jgi:hypothetical protein